MTYAKNETTETKMGAQVHRQENKIEFTRAEKYVIINLWLRIDSPTFDHPLQLNRSGIKRPLDPFLLPCKKFDKFHSSDQLI
jgi:hypothetical protein